MKLGSKPRVYVQRHLWWRIRWASRFSMDFSPLPHSLRLSGIRKELHFLQGTRVWLLVYVIHYSGFSEKLRKWMPNENRQKTGSQNSTWGNTLVTSLNVLQRSFKGLSTRYFTHAKDSTFISIKSFLLLKEEIKAICQLNLFFQSYPASAKPYYSLCC